MYVKTKKAHCKGKNLLMLLNRKTITKTITTINSQGFFYLL